MEVLARDSQPGEPEGFKAELKKADGRENKRKRETVSGGRKAGDSRGRRGPRAEIAAGPSPS
uniref:Uncharacterized protein n=1 Tax=Pavo cristatus TaxID=9049 RepID=A0A8C9FXG0_PAVCR